MAFPISTAIPPPIARIANAGEHDAESEIVRVHTCVVKDGFVTLAAHIPMEHAVAPVNTATSSITGWIYRCRVA